MTPPPVTTTNATEPENRAGPLSQTVVVVNGGSPPHPGSLEFLPTKCTVIAADGGYVHARNLGLAVDVLVGDFDSLHESLVATAAALGTKVIRHAVEKDATDLELALDTGAATHPIDLVVLSGGEGHRLDHLLGAIELLSDPRYESIRISAWFGSAHIVVVRPGQPATFTQHATSSDRFLTLIPVSTNVEGVTTTGLRYPLSNETLRRHRTRSVSNELVGSSAHIEVGSGTLIAIQPNALQKSHNVLGGKEAADSGHSASIR
jgi:thiamine pyrophosphokinase